MTGARPGHLPRSGPPVRETERALARHGQPLAGAREARSAADETAGREEREHAAPEAAVLLTDEPNPADATIVLRRL